MRSLTKVVALAASAALIASSTAAVAAAPALPSQTAQAAQPNAWMMLSALSSTRTIALGGANAAAQPADVPPPPPPVVATGRPVVTGEVLAFVLWFALIVIALTLDDNGGRPNSPA